MSRMILNHVQKSFGKTTILPDMSLAVEDGSFTVLLGPSGCGKSTMLRIIAGLEKADGGSVIFDGEDVTVLEPQERNISMVFQNYALYPHMNVCKNIEYGLRAKKIPKADREHRIAEVCKLVQLEDQMHKLPAQMSGGQRQRVALARAIVKRPRAFLMNEPLSNLDAKLRTQMRVEIADLHRQLGATFLYVTHDQVEAMSMGTHIVILNQGKIMQQGSPREIYQNPQNLFVAKFIGSPPANVMDFGGYSIALRPQDISMEKTSQHDLSLEGTVVAQEHLGGEILCYMDTNYGRLIVKCPHQQPIVQHSVKLFFSEKSLFFFDGEGCRTSCRPGMLKDLLELYSQAV